MDRSVEQLLSIHLRLRSFEELVEKFRIGIELAEFCRERFHRVNRIAGGKRSPNERGSV